REGKPVRVVQAGERIVARLEDEDGFPGGGEHVRDGGATRAAADDAEVEARELAVPEDRVVCAPPHPHEGPRRVVRVTIVSSMLSPAAESGLGTTVPRGPSSSGSAVDTGCAGSSR